MLKYMVLAAVVCCAGCQATKQDTGTRREVFNGSERLSVRVEKYVNTYEVVVQRAFLKKVEGGGSDQWTLVSAPRVSGYPEKWRRTGQAPGPDGYRSSASHLLAGELIGISLEPGVHLVAKVLPLSQNTARVIGVFSQVEATDHGMNELSVPFDLTCTLGELNVIYQKEVIVDPAVDGMDT